MGARAGAGGEASVRHGDRVSVWGDEKALEAEGGDGCTIVQACLMPLNYALKSI